MLVSARLDRELQPDRDVAALAACLAGLSVAAVVDQAGPAAFAPFEAAFGAPAPPAFPTAEERSSWRAPGPEITLQARVTAAAPPETAAHIKQAVAAAGASPVAQLSARARSGPPSPQEVREALHAAALEHGLAPEFVEAVALAESGLRADARSHKGAIGVMQLMPATAAELGVDPYQWRENVEGGVRYLREQIDRFGDLELALAAYNAGPTRVERCGCVPSYPGVQVYVSSILARAAEPGHATESVV